MNEDAGSHRRFWTPDVQPQHIPGSYSYRRQLGDGCRAARVTPGEGELVLFNSRNFHEVETNEGREDRVAVSSFLGLLPGGRLVLWS